MQELLGHKTLTMTMRYSHLAPAHKAAAVEKLAASLERPAEEPVKVAMAAPAGPGPGTSAPDLERNWNVPSGRQTAAKKK